MFDRIIKMFIAALLVVVPLAGAAKDYVVKSPSGNLVLKVATGKNLTWQVNFKGHEITAPSVLSYEEKHKACSKKHKPYILKYKALILK